MTNTDKLRFFESTKKVLNRIFEKTTEAIRITAAVDIPVAIQDQVTSPRDTYFLKSISLFSIASDITKSGETAAELVFGFDAVVGHGLVAGKEIILLDTVADRSFYAVVTGVSTNAITVDRPIDHSFSVVSTLARIVISNMAVDGSTTPQIFEIRAGSIPIDYVKFIIHIADATDMDDGKFGGMGALTNGISFRIYDGYQKVIFNFKTNGDIKQFSCNSEYSPKAPAGQYSFRATLAFGGTENHGVVLRISTDDRIQIIISDDLRDLLTLKLSGIGHRTSGEN